MNDSSENSEFGLKEDWASIQKTLEEIIPVYDKTNRYISLGTDLRQRKRGIDLLVKSLGSDAISALDLGCGTGKMAMELSSRLSDKCSIILLDPIKDMARVARSRLNLDATIGMFEFLPFRNASFDAAMSGFAIRDAKNLLRALKEISRLLKVNGKLLIVDLAKPDSKFKSGLITLYWESLARFLALLSAGRLGLKFGALATTFQRLPRNSELIRLIEKCGFQLEKVEFSMMDGACVLLVAKVGKD